MKLIAMIFTCPIVASPAAYAADFFIPISEKQSADMRGEQKSLMDKFRQEKTTKTASIIRINLEQLKQDSVALNLRPDLRVRAETKKIDKRSDTDYTWYGTLAGVPGDAILVVRGENVTGTIRSRELFHIRSLGSGLHALIQVDETKFPEDHPPSFREKEKQKGGQYLINQHKLRADTRADITPVIDVVVTYTASAQSSSGDINGLIQLAIDETNQSYQNSGIDARLRLVATQEVHYTEASRSYEEILDHFKGAHDEFMPEVHELRERHFADVTMLIINQSDYCGLADAIMATYESAFAIVHYNCATGRYSFGHEVGHLQGARHNPEEDSTDTPFAYGHGYRHSHWRTIMSYNCSPACARIQYWSNPNVTYEGVAMGTASTHDNARVLNETAATLAAFRDCEKECKADRDDCMAEVGTPGGPHPSECVQLFKACMRRCPP